jgi:hypothetical protein
MLNNALKILIKIRRVILTSVIETLVKIIEKII